MEAQELPEHAWNISIGKVLWKQGQKQNIFSNLDFSIKIAFLIWVGETF